VLENLAMFPIKKSGHEYSFREDAFLYRAPSGREREFPFSESMKIKFSPYTGRLAIRGPQGTAPLAPLATDEEKALVLEFFRRWKIKNIDDAKKAAFDYTDGQRQFLPIALGASLLVGLPVAAGLFSDSYGQYTCTTQLRNGSVHGSMNVTKFRKKRKGHYTLELNFTTPSGKTIKGFDQLIMNNGMEEAEMEKSIPKTVPVIYAQENPECWSLPATPSAAEPNWAQRRYFTAFPAMFGMVFLVISTWGLAWSAMSLIRRRRPFSSEINELFQLS
jgi:hypothetical protein